MGYGRTDKNDESVRFWFRGFRVVGWRFCWVFFFDGGSGSGMFWGTCCWTGFMLLFASGGIAGGFRGSEFSFSDFFAG